MIGMKLSGNLTGEEKLKKGNRNLREESGKDDGKHLVLVFGPKLGVFCNPSLLSDLHLCCFICLDTLHIFMPSSVKVKQLIRRFFKCLWHITFSQSC